MFNQGVWIIPAPTNQNYMFEDIESRFVKACLKYYEQGIEFSVRLSWGPISQLTNIPKGIPELDDATRHRKREIFMTILHEFYERIGAIRLNNPVKHSMGIKFLPLQSRDYENHVITFNKREMCDDY